MQIHKMASRKRIALVAHDNKKGELLEWAIFNKTLLSRHQLFGTGTTGSLVEKALDQPVTKFLSGPLEEISRSEPGSRNVRSTC